MATGQRNIGHCTGRRKHAGGAADGLLATSFGIGTQTAKDLTLGAIVTTTGGNTAIVVGNVSELLTQPTAVYNEFPLWKVSLAVRHSERSGESPCISRYFASFRMTQSPFRNRDQ
jgi:hypothetical protein